MKVNAMEDFRRDICYRTLKQEDGSILLTATMTDRFHDLRLAVTVDGETLAITAASVEFCKAPSIDCPNVAPRLQELVGTVIGRGLTRSINAALGGRDGCGNLRNLLMGLLPLAMNVKAAAGFDDEQELLDSIHNRLVGACAGYARPVVR